MEIWKKIPLYSKYEASSYGRLKTFNWKNTGQTKIMKPAYDGSGYLRTVLINDAGGYNTVKVHRIVAMTFHGLPFEGFEVNHKNAIKDDNSADNLEWVTRQENLAHSKTNNLQRVLKGEEIGNSKLTVDKVLEIRDKFIPRKYSRVRLAKEYNVSEATIKDVLYRRSWKHI